MRLRSLRLLRLLRRNDYGELYGFSPPFRRPVDRKKPLTSMIYSYIDIETDVVPCSLKFFLISLSKMPLTDDTTRLICPTRGVGHLWDKMARFPVFTFSIFSSSVRKSLGRRESLHHIEAVYRAAIWA